MTLDDYQNAASRSINPNQSYRDSLTDYGLGIAGEAGEVADLIKKHLAYGKDLPAEIVMRELGDVLWYVSQLARVFGLTLSEVGLVNIEKLLKRYPVAFDAERARTHKGE